MLFFFFFFFSLIKPEKLKTEHSALDLTLDRENTCYNGSIVFASEPQVA